MRKAEIKIRDTRAGWLSQDENGYHFVYGGAYSENGKAGTGESNLPVQEAPFASKTLFPFFDGLIPEGWLLDIAEKNWKLRCRDRMGLLLACCKDCIGAVSVHPVNMEDNK